MEIHKFSFAEIVIRMGEKQCSDLAESLPHFILLIRAQDVRAQEMGGTNGVGEQ